MFKRRRTRKFNWQINASAAGKLLGHFGPAKATEALAETWRLNLKRMPRFGVSPSVQIQNLGKTTEETVRETLETPSFQKKIQQGISREVAQSVIVRELQHDAACDAQAASVKEVAAVAAVAAVVAKTTLRNYTTKKAGVSRARINSYFTVGTNVYHKTSSKHATLSTLEEAHSRGYVKPVEIEKKQAVMVAAKVVAQTKRTVAAAMKKTATKIINTTRGQVKELTDLERIRQKYPALAAGNDKAYFLNVAGGGFVIGRIDGHSEGCVFELKHRQSRLFYEFRRYEQVQCMIYMKMLKVHKLKLIETYREKQCEHEMIEENDHHFVKSNHDQYIPGLAWSDIKQGLEDVIEKLNRAEADPEFRQTLLDILY
jgi:hypothetical protein